MQPHAFPKPDTIAQIARVFRGLFRVVMCLCLWSGPTPILHAHEKSGSVVENNPDLEDHVRICHSHDGCEECEHWHLHFMLWGEVQPDAEHSDSVPSKLPVRHIQAEFALAPSSSGTAVDLSEIELGHWAVQSWELVAGYAPSALCDATRDLAPLYAYECRVAVSFDVTRLLMIARC